MKKLRVVEDQLKRATVVIGFVTLLTACSGPLSLPTPNSIAQASGQIQSLLNLSSQSQPASGNVQDTSAIQQQMAVPPMQEGFALAETSNQPETNDSGGEMDSSIDASSETEMGDDASESETDDDARESETETDDDASEN